MTNYYRKYYNEYDKLNSPRYPQWSQDACLSMESILIDKGYCMGVVHRVGCDGEYHNAWQVERSDIPRLIEQLFRKRIVVEVQAEGKGKASINFVYDYDENHILSIVKNFWKNK